MLLEQIRYVASKDTLKAICILTNGLYRYHNDIMPLMKGICIVDKIRQQYFQKYNHIYSNFPEANTANDDFHGCVYRSVGDVIVLHFLNYVYVFIILYQFSLLLSIKSVLNKNLKCPEKNPSFIVKSKHHLLHFSERTEKERNFVGRKSVFLLSENVFHEAARVSSSITNLPTIPFVAIVLKFCT